MVNTQCVVLISVTIINTSFFLAYSRVKLNNKNDDYINANYIQYASIKKDITLSPISQSEEEIKLQEEGLLSQASLRTMNRVNVDLDCNRQYISTQGPLPTTFNDFWKLIWDERSFVIVMLTQEVEMNKVKKQVFFFFINMFSTWY